MGTTACNLKPPVFDPSIGCGNPDDGLKPRVMYFQIDKNLLSVNGKYFGVVTEKTDTSITAICKMANKELNGKEMKFNIQKQIK